MQQEIWKDIPDYDGEYQISSLGRVKSLKFGKEIILKQSSDLRGYMLVGLSKNGKLTSSKIHQLVAVAFLGHKKCGHHIVVDHIDNDKKNNLLSNIQLISHRENASKDRIGKTSQHTGVVKGRSGKWVARISLDGKDAYLGCFDSEIEAANAYKEELERINIINEVTKIKTPRRIKPMKEYDFEIQSLDQLDEFQLFYCEKGLCHVLQAIITIDSEEIFYLEIGDKISLN
jgi:hypothetical protein